MSMTDFSTARKAMIDSQLRTSGVNDKFVLGRMNAVAREDYVPGQAKTHAYIDRAIELENGRHIASPLFYGMMLAEAQPQKDDTVLIVDSGSGYLTALIQPLTGKVEVISPEEAVAATRKRGDFSLVLIDGAIEHIPESLVRRMADGGRIITGLSSKSVTRLATGCKSSGSVTLVPLAEIGIPRLQEFDQPAGWSF